jgi:hypothetical protein
MKQYILVLVLLAMSGCSMFKTITRTISDVAGDVCVMFAMDNTEQLAGMSPAEWCDIHENLAPFIEQITAAQQTAGSMAVSREAAE